MQTNSITLADVLAILRRRLTLILGVAAAVTALGVVFVHRMPDVYEATTTVYLDPGRMPHSLDRTGVAVPKLSQVVSSISQEILSRESLKNVIQEFDLYPLATLPAGDVDDATREEAMAATPTGDVPDGFDERLAQASQIAHARKDVKIEIVKVNTEDFVSITCKARTADLAARLVNRMTELLIAKNQDLRVKRAEDVREFVAEEVAKAFERLKQQEAAVFKFREENRETLPDRQPQLYGELQAAKGRILARTGQLDETRAREAELEMRIASESGLRGPEAQVGALPPPAPRPANSELASTRAELQRLLILDAELRATYREPDFPDRLKSTAMIAELRESVRRLEEEDKLAATAATAPTAPAAEPLGAATQPTSVQASLVPSTAATSKWDPVIAALGRRHAPIEVMKAVEDSVALLVGEQQKTAALEREQGADHDDVAKLEAVLAAVGATTAKLTALQASLDEAMRVHKELLVDLWESEKLLGAEKTLKNDSLHAVEPAEAPFFPAWPNRPLLAALALVAGLGIGGGAAYLLDLLAEGFYTRAQLEADLGVPVLAVLPAVPNPENLAAGELFLIVEDEEAPA